MAETGRSISPPSAGTKNGVYLARVVNNLDPTYMGSLEVEILKFTESGNLPENEGQIFTVKYMSPFYGITPVASNGRNNGFQDTQQAYGMWMVPPDVGTKVLVMFVEGNVANGYWMGCVPDQYMNATVPGATPAMTSNESGRKLPVGEYNKLTTTLEQNNPTKFIKPINGKAVETLIEQGLYEDENRGLTSSSSRRETPSNVFGISTPGPVDKAGPKVSIGPSTDTATWFASRLGGSSFVMDDGNETLLRKGHAKDTPSEYADLEKNETGGVSTFPSNELVRIKTRTGHQILLHNTEDLIYIGNSRGTTWIELTSNGKIDIFAQDSISIHTHEDLNFTADRDINFTAGEHVNMVVGKDLKVSAGQTISRTAGDFISDNAGTRISRSATTSITDFAGPGGFNLATTGAFQAAATGAIMLGSQAQVGIEGCGAVNIGADGCVTVYAGESVLATAGQGIGLTASATAVQITASTTIDLSAGTHIAERAPTIFQNGGTEPVAADVADPPAATSPAGPVQPKLPFSTTRVPMHEPWGEHENLSPLSFTPDKTRAGVSSQIISPAMSSDTFSQGIGGGSSGVVSSNETLPQGTLEQRTYDTPAGPRTTLVRVQEIETPAGRKTTETPATLQRGSAAQPPIGSTGGPF